MWKAKSKQVPTLRQEDKARFWRHIEEDHAPGCWVFVGSIGNKGYQIVVCALLSRSFTGNRQTPAAGMGPRDASISSRIVSHIDQRFFPS